VIAGIAAVVVLGGGAATGVALNRNAKLPPTDNTRCR